MAFSWYFILFWNSFLEVDFEFIDVPNPVTLETAIFGDKISRVVKKTKLGYLRNCDPSQKSNWVIWDYCENRNFTNCESCENCESQFVKVAKIANIYLKNETEKNFAIFRKNINVWIDCSAGCNFVAF